MQSKVLYNFIFFYLIVYTLKHPESAGILNPGGVSQE